MTRVHVTVNRWLATVALILSIILMGTLIYVGITAMQAASQLGDALDGLSDTSETTAPAPETYTEPTPVAPDPSDPYAADNGGFGDPYGPDGYIGDTNPDGSPCVGYGCTPEMDAELNEYESEANN